jgi:ribonucleoside-diphosphate reductase alpha chain
MVVRVIKRDGREVEFERDKIINALKCVFDESDFEITEYDMAEIVEGVMVMVESNGADTISTNDINDYVERELMNQKLYDEAKMFILNRDEKKKIESMSIDNNAMSEYIFTNRYSRFIPELNRRETWDEAVDRVRDMHIRKYPEIIDDINWAFEMVREKRVLPSMRSMQFGGKPIEDKNTRLYNCTYSAIDRVDFFKETMFLLLSGCGVGFSVEFENINKLPKLIEPSMKEIKHYTIPDTIEGWADSIDELVKSYIHGYTIEFIYTEIRKQGEPISSGGKAPSHIPLRRAIEKVRTILDDVATRDGQLKPIEAYDIVMHSADAVLAGGVRRSATICLFSPDDIDMMNAKTGKWFETDPQRGRSNNSVKLIRSETSKDQFKRIFETQKAFGEPAFYFVNNTDTGTNPCVEIGLNPYLPKGYTMPDGETLDEQTTGFQFCNLTSINGGMLKSVDDFTIAVKASAIIGTCQAGYNKFPYLGKYTEEICRRESLLGLSITGMMDNPQITLDPVIQTMMSHYAIEVNMEIAKKINIPQAARVTCVKPEGTTSILLNTASGIHPRYAKRYFRRIQANVNDPVYKHFKEQNPHCCETSVWGANGTDDVITFCVNAPKDAITKDDMTAIEFLDIIKSTQINWVVNGTALPDSTPDLTHNVSNTITVKSDEWDDVCDYIYENKEYFTGVSMLPDESETGTIYEQAPHEKVNSSDDEAIWANYTDGYQNVDYTSLSEFDDNTIHREIVACAGGSCELK